MSARFDGMVYRARIAAPHPPAASLTCGWERKNGGVNMELSGLPGKQNGAPGAYRSPASPSRKLDLRLGKEERGSRYGVFGFSRKRNGARPF